MSRCIDGWGSVRRNDVQGWDNSAWSVVAHGFYVDGQVYNGGA